MRELVEEGNMLATEKERQTDWRELRQTEEKTRPTRRQYETQAGIRRKTRTPDDMERGRESGTEKR